MSTDEASITLTQYVRPLRIAFLVAPNDRESLLKVLRVATCLWGGMFNPIVPAGRRLPAWWPRTSRYADMRSVVGGYLDTFEPDYVVATADYQRAWVKGRDILALDELLSDAHEAIGYGVSTAELFVEEYQQRYRFMLREPVTAVYPANTDNLFVAAYAGAFPASAKHDYVRAWFTRAFVATEAHFVASTFEQSLQPNALTPLRAGSLQLEVDGPMEDPTLFLLDPRRPSDVIEYWNLRATGRSIIGIPTDWAEALVPWCQRFVDERYQPFPVNSNVMLSTTLMAGHSVDHDTAVAFRHAVTGGTKSGLSYQRWYPRMWDEWARDRDSVRRCTLKHAERTIDVTPRQGRTRFDTTGPTFAEEGVGRDTPRWANIVRFQTAPYGGERAAAFPPSFAGLHRLLEMFGDSTPRATSEGIVVRTRWAGHPEFWTLPSGVELFQGWFAENGMTAALSSAGRLTLQIIRALDGMLGVNSLRHPLILTKLNQMAHGLVEYQDDETPRKLKVRGRMVPHQDWIATLQTAFPDRPKSAALNTLAALTEHGVLRLGVRVACTHCGQRNWVALDDMRSTLTCERCLQRFAFPAGDPPKRPWYYRSQGPFAVENYAQGGYAVALALRFFTLALRGSTSWTPSMELVENDGGGVSEIDFALWWQPDMFVYTEPSVIFGEAKGYGGGGAEAFTARDIQRARHLARRFPGACLVFATLKSELSKSERLRLRALAQAGRRPWRTDSWRTPVVVLTATELFGTMVPPHGWQELPGKRGELYQRRNETASLHPLLALADRTQQAYLDLPGYWQWVQDRHERQALRAARRGRGDEREQDVE